MEIKNYPKVSSMLRLRNVYNVPVHEFRICDTIIDVLSACKDYSYTCTIRTDRVNKKGTDFPFFIIRKPADISDSILKALEDGYVCIVTNGLVYDEYLIMNCVFTIARNGDFLFEYSRKNVPLRHMYRHREDLRHVCGNILEQDRVMDFICECTNTVDLRVIKDLLVWWYVHMIKHEELFGKYIEASTYRRNPRGKEMVCWEVR